VPLRQISFTCDRIPDLSHPRHRTRGIGKPEELIRTSLLHLYRDVANPSRGFTSFSFRYLISPPTQTNTTQARMTLALTLCAEDSQNLKSLEALVTRGPIASFYDLKESPTPYAYWADMKAVCHVLRLGYVSSPYIDYRDNPHGLSNYYVMKRFQPCQDGSFAALDRTYDSITSPIVMDVTLANCDVTSAITQLAHYRERLRLLDSPGLGLEQDNNPVFWEERSESSYRDRQSEAYRRDPLAAEIERDIRECLQVLNTRVLSFNIRALAPDVSTARLVASSFAENTFADGTFSLWLPPNQADRLKEDIEAINNNTVAPVPALADLFPDSAQKYYSPLEPLMCTAGVEELEGLCPLPYTHHYSLRLISKETDPPPVDPEELLCIGHDTNYEDFNDTRVGPPRGIRLRDILCHLLVVGMSGVGKTTILLAISIYLWIKWRIPVSIFAPIKEEFRVLLTLMDSPDPALREFGRTVRFYSVGSGLPNEFRNNPFAVPEGTSVERHIQSILQIFKAGTALSGPLLPLIASALFRLYEEFERRDYWPSFDDFFAVAKKVVAESGYEAAFQSHLLAALWFRANTFGIGEVGRLFRSGTNVPDDDDLRKYPAVFEFQGCNADQRSLIVHCIMERRREDARKSRYSEDMPYGVMIFDEAHTILKPSPGALPQEDNPDSGAFSSDTVCEMLQEIRACGYGIILADQSPSGIDHRALTHTASTLALRQKDTQDRDVLASVMLLDPVAADDLLRLPQGQAYLMTPGYHAACKIVTPEIRKELGLQSPPQGLNIVPYLLRTTWFRDHLNARLLSDMSAFSSRVAEVESQAKAAHVAIDRLYDALATAKVELGTAEKPTLPASIKQQYVVCQKSADTLAASLANMSRLYRALVPEALPDCASGLEAEDEWIRIRDLWAAQSAHMSSTISFIKGALCAIVKDIYSEKETHNAR